MLCLCYKAYARVFRCLFVCNKTDQSNQYMKYNMGTISYLYVHAVFLKREGQVMIEGQVILRYYGIYVVYTFTGCLLY